MSKLEMRLVDLLHAINTVRYLLVDEESKEPIKPHLRTIRQAAESLEALWEEQRKFAKAMRLR